VAIASIVHTSTMLVHFRRSFLDVHVSDVSLLREWKCLLTGPIKTKREKKTKNFFLFYPGFLANLTNTKIPSPDPTILAPQTLISNIKHYQEFHIDFSKYNL